MQILILTTISANYHNISAPTLIVPFSIVKLDHTHSKVDQTSIYSASLSVKVTSEMATELAGCTGHRLSDLDQWSYYKSEQHLKTRQ